MMLAVAAVVVGAASLAWACTPQAQITLSPQEGAPGSTVIVRGSQFVPDQPVQIYWGSSSGTPLGQATGPSFSKAVTIPENASAGVTNVVARSGVWEAKDAFKVVPNDPPPPSGPGGGSSNPPGGGGSKPGGAGQPTGNPNGTGQRDSGGPGGGPDRADRTGAPGSGGPATGAERSARGGLRSNPAVMKTRSGQVVFGGSVPVGAPQAAAGAIRSTRRSASGDLWSGFSSPARASLTPGLTDQAGAATPGAGLRVGIGLLSTGLVALFGGLLVAEVRRRRAAAARVAGQHPGERIR